MQQEIDELDLRLEALQRMSRDVELERERIRANGRRALPGQPQCMHFLGGDAESKLDNLVIPVPVPCTRPAGQGVSAVRAARAASLGVGAGHRQGSAQGGAGAGGNKHRAAPGVTSQGAVDRAGDRFAPIQTRQSRAVQWTGAGDGARNRPTLTVDVAHSARLAIPRAHQQPRAVAPVTAGGPYIEEQDKGEEDDIWASDWSVDSAGSSRGALAVSRVRAAEAPQREPVLFTREGFCAEDEGEREPAPFISRAAAEKLRELEARLAVLGWPG